MPNWCENNLEVVGTKPQIEAFLEFATGGSPFDFNRVIPYPEEFRRLDEIADAWDREHEGRSDCDWLARPKDGFNSGGCEWRVAHWGTRWNACDVEREGPLTGDDEDRLKVVFHFYTPWSAPKPVVEKAAQLFPALRFVLCYYEPRCQFHGIFCWRDGELETHECGPDCGDCGG